LTLFEAVEQAFLKIEAQPEFIRPPNYQG